jgi:hypothetical protein
MHRVAIVIEWVEPASRGAAPHAPSCPVGMQSSAYAFIGNGASKKDLRFGEKKQPGEFAHHRAWGRVA